MTTYRLSDIVSPAFSEPHKTLKAGIIDQLVLKGGRGSAKSSYASVEGILQIIKNPEIHGVAMRKVSNTMRTTILAQYIWAYTEMGLYNKFRFTVSPMEVTYKETGQKIFFFGADDPGKLKSLKVPFGYVGFLHLEELDQFAGEDEVRNIEQSVLRGGDISIEIKTFNPPKTRDNWANKYCELDKPGQLIHHSTYLTTPEKWLGPRFINDAEYLKQTNPKAYEHEYLGKANSSGGMVFENVIARDITDDEIRRFDRIYNGVDWGYYPDPWAFNRMHFSASDRTLYIFDEATAHKKTPRKTGPIVKAKISRGELVTCDSSPPENANDYIDQGINAVRAEKGPGSVDRRHEWLQGLNAIVIDRIRCPDTYREFSEYEYEKTKEGLLISGYPDKNNHHIDAVCYGLEQLWKYREERRTPLRQLLR